ncbi:hypothetical protein ALP75_204703 [Pseudomonas syringae pv. actinidiae]|nr:hypothetical protein ALP75_204703 [Pseudomonas syringae pv. actinidiae]
MLLGQNLGRRHQRDLITGFQCLQGSQRGDHGLARADVALNQPQHRLGLAQVVGHLLADTLLRASGRKTQIGEKLFRQLFREGQRGCTL